MFNNSCKSHLGQVAEWSNAYDSKSYLFGGARSNRALVDIFGVLR